MKIIIFALFLFSLNIYASTDSIRVMSFNTTCALCNKGFYDKFKYRRHWIVDTIKRNSPDIISLQELLTSHQLKWVAQQLKDYDLYYGNYRVFKFSDSALLIRKDRFKVGHSGGYWLGRRGGEKFSFGWKFGLPRRVQWAMMIDTNTMKEFTFVGGHFDNREINKNNSAKFVVETFSNLNTPVIFAGDTNLKPGTSGFLTLESAFRDTFAEAQNFVMIRNSDTGLNDGCNIEKGSVFPDCRVDHIMVSTLDNWNISTWGIDQFKYGKDQKFTSDHRAIFSDIELN